MDNTILINKRVEVIARYRKQADCGSLCYPARMRYQNREVVFTELGLRHPTSQGKRMVHVFDMSDGCDDYRLEFDAEMLTWTLVAILPGYNSEAASKRRPSSPGYRRKTGRPTLRKARE